MRSNLTPERRTIRRDAERVACLALALCAGRSPEQIAAEIAARVVHNLRAKPPTEAAQREVAL